MSFLAVSLFDGSCATRANICQSLFGINTVKWEAVWYLASALPLFIVSVILVISVPPMMAARDRHKHHTQVKRIRLRQGDFTLLGEETPTGDDSAPFKHLRNVSPSSDRSPTSGVDPARQQERDETTSEEGPRGRQRSGTNTFYGIHRSPGVVGSRRKNLHDDDTRRERMHMKDFEREVNRAAGYGPNLQPAHASDRGWTWRDGERRRKRGGTVDEVDGTYDLPASTSIIADVVESRGQPREFLDVEKLGSQRQRLCIVHG